MLHQIGSKISQNDGIYVCNGFSLFLFTKEIFREIDALVKTVISRNFYQTPYFWDYCRIVLEKAYD